MNFKISKFNPFCKTINIPHAFAWEKVSDLKNRKGIVKALDYGAYDGSLLDTMSKSDIVVDSISVDLNFEIVTANEKQKEKNNKLIHIVKNTELPFESESFDVVLLIGVLEHVHEQERLLFELNRVLKKDGEFIIAVPGKHIFSFLDFGNWKFIFPKIHKAYVELFYGKEFYFQRFIECSNGLIGDIEVEKKWHEHFSHKKLKRILNRTGFEVIEQDGFGLFYRIFHNIKHFLTSLSGFFDQLIMIDGALFSKAEIFARAKKK